MPEPQLCGVFAVKLPVADLQRSRSWYERTFGLRVELEFPDDEGVVRGVAGHLPGVADTFLALREDAPTAAALSGVNLVNLAVEDRGQVDAWARRLDELGIDHSPVIDATVGWMVVLHDPDGLEVHIYSRQEHGIDSADRPGYGRPVTAASSTQSRAEVRAGEWHDGELVAHDGVRLAYRVYGRGYGRALLLLHGGGANLESMTQFAERLGEGRTTVSFDARGCGQSGDPERFRWADAVRDVESVVASLGLGPVDIVGHSMGGFVAGFYASTHPGARVVSIDGFGPGMPTVGSAADREEFEQFQTSMKAAFWAMTEPPESGDRSWRDAQVEAIKETLAGIGYTAPNARQMAERNLVDLGDGRYRRHPARSLFEGGFADGGDDDTLRMYRHVACPTMIIRCTESGAPDVLDLELDSLITENPRVEIVRLPLTHLAPAWDAIDEVVDVIRPFLLAPHELLGPPALRR